LKSAKIFHYSNLTIAAGGARHEKSGKKRRKNRFFRRCRRPLHTGKRLSRFANACGPARKNASLRDGGDFT